IQLGSNRPASQPRRLEPHQSPTRQSSSQQIGERVSSRVHHPGPAMMPPHFSSFIPSQQGHIPHAQTSSPSMMPPHSPRTLHQSTPERPHSRRNVDVFDIRDEDLITEAGAHKRLTSYIVIRLERATDPSAVDSQGSALSPTWEKASHLMRKDVSQRDARRQVRKLDTETGSVADKKRCLPSAIRRQLEHAWRNLERAEDDARFVYTLAQVDLKSKGVETDGREKKHKKRSKDRHRSKGSSRGETKREPMSVTAYFRREPGRNGDCVRMLKMQLAERRQDGGEAHDDHLPTMARDQSPPPRPIQAGAPTNPSRQSAFEPQLQRRLILSQPFSTTAHHPARSAHPPPAPFPPPGSHPLPLSLPVHNSRNISQAIEAQNRRIQSHAPGMERQPTARSYNSRSSVTSFSSLSTEDSERIITPSSSLGQSHSLPRPRLHQSHHHHDGLRGRSRDRQHRIGDDSVVLEVARPPRRHNPAESFISIPPAAPDPIEAVSEADTVRRREQRTYQDGVMDAQHTARSIAGGSAPRPSRSIRDPSEGQKAPVYRTARSPAGGNHDMDQLGNRVSRTSLADGPRNRPGQARDPITHHGYMEAPRRRRDGFDDDGLVTAEPVRGTWRRRDAQRYMAERRRTDQDAWDLGRTSPLQYGEGQRRVSRYSSYRR
ncbi:hypothetical protein BBK36DRAFT_1081682, partial [Trichoderma citrinoviride]